MKVSRFILIITFPALLSGCDMDLFNLGCRNIGQSGYALCQAEDKSLYYLQRSGDAISGGGVLDGTVKTIGWDSSSIIASRYSTFRGDPDGLMVLDIRSGRLSGPIDPKDIERAYPTIKQQSARVVWSTLQ
jgi:hypothetical protein